MRLRQRGVGRTPCAQHGSRRERGQGLVEFALVIPIFCALTFGVIDFGRVIWASNTLTDAAAEAARYAIVHGGTPANTCPVGTPSPDAVIPAPSPSCPYPSPSKQAIRDVATSAARVSGVPVTVTVCYGEGCSGNTDAVGASNARGNAITVRVSASAQLITTMLVGQSTFALSGSSTMLVNF